MKRVKDTENLIRQRPNIGQIDPLFASRAATYRSIIVNGLNKMVYRIDDDIISIVAFWDTRMEPNEQRDQTIARNESDESRERSTEGQPEEQAARVKQHNPLTEIYPPPRLRKESRRRPFGLSLEK